MGDRDATPVAVLGLGSMGATLAEVLAERGARVTVWNRSPDKAAAFEGRATIAASAGAAVAAADAVVVCVTDHGAAGEILDDPAVAGALAGRALIMLTGGTPAESRATAERAAGLGAAYLDGSILAYPEGIRNRSAMIVYSGDRATFDNFEHVLHMFGDHPMYLAEAPGTCFVLDKATFVLFYGAMACFFHGAAMAKAAGIPMEAYLAASANQYSEIPRLVDWFGQMLLTRSYGDAEASIAVSAAAHAPAVDISRELGIDTSLPEVIAALFDRAMAAGHGDDEIAALYEVLLERPRP